MAKLRSLVDCLAHELSMKRESVNVLAMELRKAGLIRSTGRGLHAAEMGPTDATNLLLAGLGGGFAIDAPETVQILRSARCTGCKRAPQTPPWEEFEPEVTPAREPAPLPIPVLQALPAKHSLGEALDAIIGEIKARRDIKKEKQDKIRGMTFSVTRTATYLTAEIYININDIGYWVDYWESRVPIDFLFDGAKPPPGKTTDELFQKFGLRHTTEKVFGRIFYEIAACLSNDMAEG